MAKTRQDNNVNDHTSLLYAEYESKLSWPIRQGTMYDEDKKKRITMLLIVEVWSL